MASVVFLRGANVGGHRVFMPSALARDLAHLGTVNVGAAGTFVIRRTASQTMLRAEFLKKLPIQAELMICSSRDILDLVGRKPFSDRPSGKDVSRYVTILSKSPRTPPALPIHQPPGDTWQVKVFQVTGRFALSLHRRLGKTLVYPNEVVEKKLGVPATTRNWNTFSAICTILEGG
jgi:uncharacterized protein (DUF1697 family)